MIIKFYDIDWFDAHDCWEQYRGTDPFDLPEVIIFDWIEYDSFEDMRADDYSDEDIAVKLADLMSDFTAFISNGFLYKEATKEEFQGYWDEYDEETDWTINPQPYIEIPSE